MSKAKIEVTSNEMSEEIKDHFEKFRLRKDLIASIQLYSDSEEKWVSVKGKYEDVCVLIAQQMIDDESFKELIEKSIFMCNTVMKQERPN